VSDRRLVQLYPRAWRARYGAELEELLRVMRRDGRLSWRARLDVATGAVRERGRSAGLHGPGLPGALLVLCAWAGFVFAGALVQRGSEHWRDTSGGSLLPAIAFDALIGLAVVAGILAVAGVCAALPAVVRLLRAGGDPALARPFARAVVVGAAAVVATGLLVVWAHGLTTAQRDGNDALYAAGFIAWALVVLAALAAWTALAVAIARRLDLGSAVERAELRLARAVATAMVAMTTATLVWWVAGATVSAPLVAAGVAGMMASSAVGLAGARAAARPAA
jgi:hypothetical protein